MMLPRSRRANQDHRTVIGIRRQLVLLRTVEALDLVDMEGAIFHLNETGVGYPDRGLDGSA